MLRVTALLAVADIVVTAVYGLVGAAVRIITAVSRASVLIIAIFRCGHHATEIRHTELIAIAGIAIVAIYRFVDTAIRIVAHVVRAQVLIVAVYFGPGRAAVDRITDLFTVAGVAIATLNGHVNALALAKNACRYPNGALQYTQSVGGGYGPVGVHVANHGPTHAFQTGGRAKNMECVYGGDITTRVRIPAYFILKHLAVVIRTT